MYIIFFWRARSRHVMTNSDTISYYIIDTYLYYAPPRAAPRIESMTEDEKRRLFWRARSRYVTTNSCASLLS